MEIEISKVCTNCKYEKCIRDFYKDKKGKNGFRSCCKTCMNEFSSEYHKNNSEKRNIYRQANSEKIKTYRAKYRKNNSEKIKENRAKYYKDNHKRENSISAEYHKNNLEKIKELKAKRIEDLPDSYIRHQLKIQNYPQELINNPEIIEIKRITIKTKRLCKTSQN